MESTREVTRKEFLKCIPQYVMQNVRSLLEGRLDFLEEGKAGTLEENPADSKAAKVAQLDEERCLAWEGGSCQFCYLACPLRDQAIILDDQKPAVNVLFCDGCARCVTACQTVSDRPALKMVVSKV